MAQGASRTRSGHHRHCVKLRRDRACGLRRERACGLRRDRGLWSETRPRLWSIVLNPAAVATGESPEGDRNRGKKDDAGLTREKRECKRG